MLAAEVNPAVLALLPPSVTPALQTPAGVLLPALPPRSAPVANRRR